MLTTAAVACIPPSAWAADDALQATTGDDLAVEVTTPASPFVNFSPGHTAASSAVVTVTSTGGWALEAVDAGGDTPGHMDAAATGCAGSDPFLTEPLVVLAEPTGTGRSLGRRALQGAPVTLAEGDLSDTVKLTYEQVLPAVQTMRRGCSYSLTVTYAVQPRA